MVQVRQSFIAVASMCFLSAALAVLSGCQTQRFPRGPSNPHTAEDYERWAVYYTNHNDVNNAIASFTKAIALAPDVQTRCRYLRSRGGCLHNQYRHYLDPNAKQDIKGAEEDFNEAVRLCPEDTLARQSRALFYSNTGRPDKGVEDYNWLIAREPGNPHFYDMRARAYAVKGDFRLALTDANEAIVLSKGARQAFYYRERAAIRFNFWDEGGLADLDKAIALSKNADDKCSALLCKGRVLEQLGRPADALKVYEQCLRQAQVASLIENLGPGALLGGLNAASAIASNFGTAAVATGPGAVGVGAGTGVGAGAGGVTGLLGPPSVVQSFSYEARRGIERIKAAQASSLEASKSAP